MGKLLHMAPMSRTLESAGGSGWNSAYSSKKRVYFNGPESVVGLNETVYFDVLAGTWHDRAGAQLSAAAEAAARAVIGV